LIIVHHGNFSHYLSPVGITLLGERGENSTSPDARLIGAALSD